MSENSSSLNQPATPPQPGQGLGRKTVIGANVVVMIIIAIVICGIVSYVNNRHYHRFDCTASGKYSLTSKTKNILKGLDKPIVVTTMFNRGDRFTWKIFDQVKDMLTEYTYQTDKIKVVHIDPLSELTKAEEIAKRVGGKITLNSVIFESEGKSKHADIKELIEKKFPFKFKGEEVFTAAILNVSEERRTGVFFTTGHGERSIEEFKLFGLSEVTDSLKRDNYMVVPLDLLTKKEIPDSCDILVISGPTKSFSVEEVNIIRNFLLERDGKLFVMLEPALGHVKPSGLKELLRDYNVEIRDDSVVYNLNMTYYGATTDAKVFISKDNYQEHKITKDLAKYTTVFFGAIPVNIVPTKNVQQGFNVWKLVQAPDRAWGETQVAIGKKPVNDKDIDIQLPFSIAVAVEPIDPETAASIAHGAPIPKPGSAATKGPRLVVIGDADFATNDYIENYPGNLDIFLNSITWLAQKETQLGISAKPQDFRQAVIRPIQMRVIYWTTVVGIPAIGIVIGSIVWWRRRR